MVPVIGGTSIPACAIFCGKNCAQTRMSVPLVSYAPQDTHHTCRPGAAQVLRQAERVSFELHVASFTADLGKDVANLRYAGGAHGMTFGLEAARGVDWFFTGARGRTRGLVGSAAASFYKPQIFERHDLGDREAIVQFGK